VSVIDSRRILIVDDNRAIHEDFRKILSSPEADERLQDLEDDLFGETPSARHTSIDFRLDSAYQGSEALMLVQQAVSEGQHYSVAFIDMRMPPGWDGLETIERLWAIDPEIQMVICSAYSDHDWADIVRRLGRTDNLLVLKKPFDVIEVLQCAHALASKWRNERALREQVDSLEKDITDRTQGLEAANKQLRHLATHDSLTGLPNRVLLDDRMSQAIVHAERAGEGFAVCVLDLDRLAAALKKLSFRERVALLAGLERLAMVAPKVSSSGSVFSAARLKPAASQSGRLRPGVPTHRDP